MFMQATKKNVMFLIMTLFMLFMPMVSSVPVQAMSVDDLAIKYESGGKIGMGDEWSENSDQASAWNKIFEKYKGVIVGFTGIGFLTMVFLFIKNFIELGKNSTNPQRRTESLVGLLWTGIAAAGLGGVTIFVSVSIYLLK